MIWFRDGGGAVAVGGGVVVGAGAVVVKDVPDFALILGNPGRISGWMCKCGNRINFEREEGLGACRACQQIYKKMGQEVSLA